VDVLSAIRVAYEGETVSQVYRGNQVIDVSVVLAPAARRSVAQVGDLPIKTPSGSIIPLSKLAEIGMPAGRYVVLRDGARRVQTITFDVGGKELSGFIAEAQKKIAESVTFPPGSYFAFEGAAEAQAKAQRDLLVNSGLAGLAIIALLAIVMGNARNLGLILLNLPFALVGGVLAVVMTGGMLTLGALVGFVTLFGISLRNSVMMMSHFEHLVLAEGEPWNMQTVLRGASERLLPILMTALVTALGLLPLAIGSGDPGREIEGPMAIVILGGLATSTLLNLFVLPGLAWRFAYFKQQEV
ncbi:MAG: efflux RND transporter permease subunit, partial [Pseudomonadota bacterium]|nr:efflux RND transporter permease subunit [Pseudomonadota bacterium]